MPDLSVLRKKPRRCAHQVYSTRSPRSRAMSSAILFSKPSRRSFENGRLFGSAQMRSSRGPLGVAGAAATSSAVAPNASSRKGKDIEHSAFGGLLRQIANRVAEAEG